ncbi:hypothetical protein BM613_12710 [Sulfoacidibacillus thermotolerans]|uniref:EAL domain-containing protein n=1 Tax=Sulfoacidibacillus thermotolerans TaxID=1765684 RepID=A0A2U3D5R2_SULT2|nr:hypothetical protein BM613_12710 [Sulfoacidibacillus thermotolerans]
MQIIGYETLIRGGEPNASYGAKEVFARAKTWGGVQALDQKIRDLQVQAGIPLLTPPQRLFLNLSPQAFNDPTWNVIHQFGKQIVLEISEHAKVGESDIAWLQTFRAQGVHIAIDDFGVGRSSLQTIAALRPEYVKLDMSFVQNGDFETVRRMRRLAEDWETTLIVEGVETKEQARCVLDAGVRYIQGYFFGSPFFLTVPP